MKSEEINRKVKVLLCGIILAVLFLPMLQSNIFLVEEEPLHGDIEVMTQPTFSMNDWFSGNYQKESDIYLTNNFGFHHLMVRLSNQIYYSVFSEANANGVVVGKEGYLYEENYIKAHLGMDFIGEKKIRSKVEKIHRIRSILNIKGKEIIIVLAPGKGSYFSEFIPDRYASKAKSTTNYSVYKRMLEEKNIPSIDLNLWFRQMKDSSRYALFPKNGIHWSRYGELIAADSILGFINGLGLEKKCPRISMGKIWTTNTPGYNDDDIEKGMNLLFDLPDLEMAYPEFSPVSQGSIPQPRVLVVADSYYWGMYNWGLSKDYLGNGEFWYYNEEVHPSPNGTQIKVKDRNFVKEVENHDVIVLLITDSNLSKFAFGFIEDLFKSLKMPTYESLVSQYEGYIRATPEWLNSVKMKANQSGMTLEEAIRDNAEYVVNLKYKGKL